MKIKECITGRAEIREQLKFRNYVLGFMVLIGVLFYVLMVLDVGFISELAEKGAYIYGGIAGGYIFVGLMCIVKNNRLLKNEKLLKKYSIAVKDERNINIQRRSMSIAVIIYMWAGVITGLIIAPFNDVAASIIFYSICALLVIYCVVRFVMNKLM